MEFICYTHSTVAELPDSVKRYQEQLLKATASPKSNINLYARISLIWKKGNFNYIV